MWNKIKTTWAKFKKWLIALFIGGTALATISTVNFNGAIEPVSNKAIGCDELLSAGEESLFAEIDTVGNVLRVIVIDCEVLMSGKWGDPKNWVRTYANGKKRFNYAGRGYKFDKDNSAFIPPKPIPDLPMGILDHALDTQTFKWKEVK